MRKGTVLRAMRTAVFAAVCALFAALGHATMSGAPLPWWAVSGAFCATAAGTWRLARRERSPLVVGAAAVGAQAVLHAVFSFAQALTHPLPHTGAASLARQWLACLLCVAPAGASTPAATAHGGAATGSGHGQTAGHLASAHEAAGHMAGTHGMSGMGGMDGVGGMDGLPHVMGGTGLPGGAVGMLALHLLVALLAALWLSGGERAAFQLVRALSARLFAPLDLAVHGRTPLPPPRGCGRVRDVRRPLRLYLLVHAISSRGPPRPVLAT
ncbi:PE-PGRS family protein [Streptomyces sp. NPDC047108]|uniref:PE-PGRS family protein n=1 Tax=Streptomyces sp. NPDC047108 TaxID=3155025 RepID=UPI0033F8C7AD